MDSTISTLSAADPGRSLDENDEEFKRFLQTKPKLDAPARDRVQRAIGAEEAERRVMEKMTPQLDALSMKQKEIELKPKVDALVRQVGDGVLNLLAGDARSSMSEAAKAYKDKGDAGLGDLPLEAEVMRSEVEILSTLVTEYSHIAKGVRAFDGGNPYHAGLLK